jgi:hypothetical protein
MGDIKSEIERMTFSCILQLLCCKSILKSDVTKKSKGVSTESIEATIQPTIATTKFDTELHDLVTYGQPPKRNFELQIVELQISFNKKLDACNDESKKIPDLHLDEHTSLVLVARRMVGPIHIVTALASTSEVERVIVLDCGFTDDMARQTAITLARGCRMLSALILPHNRITSVGIRHLSAGLMIHAALHTLDLSGNACGDRGSESLAVLVCSSPALRVLNLSSNGIGPAGAALLAAALVPYAHHRCSDDDTLSNRRCGVALAELDLSHNRIGDTGARSFAAALCESACALRALDLSCNIITSRGARRLAAALCTNHALVNLRVVSIALGDEEEAAIEALESASRAIAL